MIAAPSPGLLRPINSRSAWVCANADPTARAMWFALLYSGMTTDVFMGGSAVWRAPDATRCARPVRGETVALPGLRRDGSTKVELRHDGVDLLARLNEPVKSLAAGIVKRIEALPQGGFAIVTAHTTAGLVSIVSGLRDIVVAPGAKVEAGQPLGLAGRNLDGAAVVSIEIWRDRRAQDAARLLRARPAL